MNYLFDLIDIFGLIFELFIINVFLKIFLEDKKPNKIINTIIYLIYLLIMYSGVKVPLLKPYFFFIAFSCTYLISITYLDRVYAKIIYSTIIFSMFIASEIIVGLLLTLFLQVDVKSTQDNVFYYLCGVVFSKFIIFILIKIISLIKLEKSNFLKTKKVLPLIVLVLSTAFVICIISYSAYSYNSEYLTFLTVIAVMILILSNILVIYLIDKLINLEHSKQKLDFAEKQLNIQSNYYNQLIDKQIRIAKINHDMKNSLISILGYINECKYDSVKDKITSLYNDVTDSKQAFTCANPCLSAILNSKFEIAYRLNVKVNSYICIPNTINIDNIDLCIIIGNALDNALEACEKMEMNQQKYIVIKISYSEEYISIYIENSLSSKKNSKKNDELLHGYGQMNIKSLCEKYRGHACFEKDKTCYKTYIMIKNEIF